MCEALGIEEGDVFENSHCICFYMSASATPSERQSKAVSSLRITMCVCVKMTDDSPMFCRKKVSCFTGAKTFGESAHHYIGGYTIRRRFPLTQTKADHFLP